jgi:hypothetical protein
MVKIGDIKKQLAALGEQPQAPGCAIAAGVGKGDSKRKREEGAARLGDDATLLAVLGGEGGGSPMDDGGSIRSSKGGVDGGALAKASTGPELTGRAAKRARAEEKQKRKKKTLHLNRQLGDLAQRKWVHFTHHQHFLSFFH